MNDQTKQAIADAARAIVATLPDGFTGTVHIDLEEK